MKPKPKYQNYSLFREGFKKKKSMEISIRGGVKPVPYFFLFIYFFFSKKKGV